MNQGENIQSDSVCAGARFDFGFFSLILAVWRKAERQLCGVVVGDSVIKENGVTKGEKEIVHTIQCCQAYERVCSGNVISAAYVKVKCSAYVLFLLLFRLARLCRKPREMGTTSSRQKASNVQFTDFDQCYGVRVRFEKA